MFSSPNTAGDYAVNGKATDTDNAAHTTMTTATQAYTWDPPCYLDAELVKVSQTDSLDQLRTSMQYNLKAAQHGDNACRDTTSTVAITGASGTPTFITQLSAADQASAMSSEGFSINV